MSLRLIGVSLSSSALKQSESQRGPWSRRDSWTECILKWMGSPNLGHTEITKKAFKQLLWSSHFMPITDLGPATQDKSVKMPLHFYFYLLNGVSMRRKRGYKKPVGSFVSSST